MKTDAVYFPHFSNARNDRKVKRVIKELGIEGYGIYFMILETLRDQPEMRYPVEDIDLLADEFGTSEQKVRAVVTLYKLFDVDESQEFFSPRLIQYLEPLFAKRKQAKKAIEARWAKQREKNLLENQQVNTDVLPENNASNTNVIQRKEKKRKEKKRKLGEFENVFLLEEELTKLKDKFPDYLDRIERLSIYVSSTGKKYKSHYATILAWARKEDKPNNHSGKVLCKTCFNSDKPTCKQTKDKTECKYYAKNN